MRTKLFWAYLLLLVLSSCRQRELLEPDTVSNIINACYNGIGKPAWLLTKELSDLGIQVESIDPYECDSSFRIKKTSYEISYYSRNDSVLGCRYEFYFTDNYVNGVDLYFETANVVVNKGWEKWEGNANHTFDSIQNRVAFISDTREWAKTNKASCLMVEEHAERQMEDKILFARCTYWAESSLGVNPDTGEGLSPDADTEIIVQFQLSTLSVFE